MKDSAPLDWRKFPERYNLRGNYCEECGTAFFPARAICPKCRRKGKLVKKDMPRTGKIYSFTKLHVAPTGFRHETPYYLAIIELENKARVLAQLVDTEGEKVKIGAKVKKMFRKMGQADKYGTITYAYKFRIVK